MSDFRRNLVPGGTYFFTVVTHGRRPILTTPLGRRCLRLSIEHARNRWPFTTIAIVLLPDHLHAVFELPRGDDRYSLRWQKIKEHFTRAFIAAGGREGTSSASRARKQERSIWQRRFWEHTVRDADDLKRCVDYLHWNPVKHGLVRRVADYRWSTFHRFVAAGEYEVNWGGANPSPDFAGGE
jgi:putative transposase